MLLLQKWLLLLGRLMGSRLRSCLLRWLLLRLHRLLRRHLWLVPHVRWRSRMLGLVAEKLLEVSGCFWGVRVRWWRVRHVGYGLVASGVCRGRSPRSILMVPLNVVWHPSAKHDLRAGLLLRVAILIEVDIALRHVLLRHLNTLMALHDLVLVGDAGGQLSHLTNDDLLAVADELTGRLLKPGVRPRLVNLL